MTGPATAADHVLAIDVGTQSVRALVFDPRGTLIAASRIPIEPYVSPHPGWAEQDAELYWRSIGEACAGLWAGGMVRRESIAGISLTSQRGTVVVTDDAGAPLRPAMVWLDQRRTEGLKPIGGAMGLAFRALGVRNTVAAFQAECEANWISANEPETWRGIRHYLLLSGFLVHRLTGRFVDSVAGQVGYLPFDFKRFAWARSGDWRWKAAPIDPAWLPELVAPGSALGGLTASAAAVVGLPEATPVIAAAGDKACEALGSGALEPHIGAISYGTTATISTTQTRYVEAVPLVPPYPAAIPRAWSLEVQVYRGYWMVDWFKRQFGSREVAQATELGVPPEALFDDLVRDTPPGSMGLLLQPTWSPGIRIPGPEAKAPLRELRVSGGGAQSPAAVQLTADIFGLPTGRPHTHETSGLGAAIDAAVGLGLHPSFSSAVAEMTHVAETIDPDRIRNELYDDLYERVYRRMYARLKPLYEEIREITGYPPH